MICYFHLQVMQTNAAVFRTGEVLQEGIEKLNQIISDAKSVKVIDTTL